MFEAFEKATGVKVNFVRFSSGKALARVIAEKNNPPVDVLFGGPVETHATGIAEGVFEAYKPPAFARLPARCRQADVCGWRLPTHAPRARASSRCLRSTAATRPRPSTS